jgi:2-amino-4-hydroxy-6-hydroxymethyldihydropteridine diphosphokinase
MSRDIAFVALGSNLGDRAMHLARAREAIAALPRSRLLAISSIEETLPIGPSEQGKYLNQMVAIETELSPRELLVALQEIERVEGRVRDARWGPRTLDLDIVRFERQTAQEPDLIVPHPSIADRGFWQRELSELRDVISPS